MLWPWHHIMHAWPCPTCFTEFEVKELSKRASGQAFEVILSPSTSDPKGELLLSPLKKRETSLDEIKKKLDAAEERRKVLALSSKLWSVVIVSVNLEHECSIQALFAFRKVLFCHFARARELKCWNSLLRSESMKRRFSRRPWRRAATSARWHKRKSIRRWKRTKRAVLHRWQLSLRNSRRG